MSTNPDITSRADIEKFITSFYEKVKTDEVIGFIFTDVVKMDWDRHIPVITDFWETILLDNPVYTNNAMAVHYTLNQKVPLKEHHFTTWVRLFTETVDEYYEGKIADLAKTRAQSIAALMQHKMSAAQ
jgi:hemoglobin